MQWCQVVKLSIISKYAHVVFHKLLSGFNYYLSEIKETIDFMRNQKGSSIFIFVSSSASYEEKNKEIINEILLIIKLNQHIS